MRKFFFVTSFIILSTFAQCLHGQDSLKVLLEGVYDADQRVRNDRETLIEKFGLDSPQVDSMKTIMLRLDSLNEAFMKSFLEEHGFLGRSKVGDKGLQAEFLVIQHSGNLDFQKKWLPEIWHLTGIGELPYEMAAMLDDRVRLRTGLKQLYGTQFKWNPDNNEWQLEDIEDPENVNKRRSELGMGTIEEYLNSFNKINQ